MIVVRKTSVSPDEQRGTVRDILFKDIEVTCKSMPPSSFTGDAAAHDVRGVTIENLRWNGRPVTDGGASG